jgi:hypothetical protein
MSDSDRALENASAVLRRVSEGHRARQTRRRARRRRRLAVASQRLGLLTAIAILGLIVLNAFVPIGATGLLLFALATLILWGVVFAASAEPEARTEELAQVDLARLPQRTESWLDQQRAALPAPAMPLVDGIGLKLDMLAPQLATLDPGDPAAFELRKLIGRELPELIDGYRRVPAALRGGETRLGLHPDKQLLDGLAVVDQELGRMAEQLAAGDLHKLATQGRYLELKYRGDAET